MKFVSIENQFKAEFYRSLERECEVTTGLSYATLLKIGKFATMLLLATLGLAIVGTATVGIILFSSMIAFTILGESEGSLIAARILMAIGFLILLSVVVGFFYEATRK